MKIIYFIVGGPLGFPIFSLKGNQGQGWKPAMVRYIGTADMQVLHELENLDWSDCIQ